MKILIVEDNEADAELMVRHLTHSGIMLHHDRVATQDGLRRALTSGKHDIVLCDYRLPGFTAAAALTIRDEIGSDIPIIVVSGTIGEEGAADLMRAGAADVVLKDNMVRLVPAIGRALEQVDSARERRDAEERLRTLMETLPNALLVVAADGRMEYANARATSLFGYDNSELIGQPVELLLPADLRARHADHRRAYHHAPVRREMGTAGSQLWGRHKDGSTIPIEASLSPIPSKGEIVVACIVRDVRGRLAVEAQLRQAQKMEAVGELTGGIAHDFNNMLTVIIGNAEMMASSLPADSELQADLEDLHAAAKRGATMIAHLLRFSRKGVLALQPVRPSIVVTSIGSILQRLLPSDIHFELADESDPGHRVMADTGAVEQILMNLCTNARDAMRSGDTLRIECQSTILDEGYHGTHPWVVPGDYVAVSVSDTGKGMDEETKRRVFEPFFTTKPPNRGTGLGMAMVYGLMKEHRGMVHVYSELGEGTTIKLYFPVVVDETAVLQDDSTLDPRQVPGGSETILLVEDDPGIRRTTRRALEGKGYTLIVAGDGEEALELFGHHQPGIGLVISDLVMPRLGGTQLLSALRARSPQTPVLLTSGYSADAGTRSREWPAGVSFLQKPWTLTDLFVLVRGLLDQSERDPIREHGGSR